MVLEEEKIIVRSDDFEKDKNKEELEKVAPPKFKESHEPPPQIVSSLFLRLLIPMILE
jgi:hypothetical protein